MNQPNAFTQRVETPLQSRVNQRHFYEYGNLPIRLPDGRLPLIPKNPDPHEDLNLTYETHTKRFRLWDPEENAEYHRIHRGIGKGWIILRYEHKRYVESQINWVILLSWIDQFQEPAANAPILGKDSRPIDGTGTDVYR